MPCAIYHQLPAAYYLAARFPQDFESAVLHAVNGGGQNQARAILTGALAGAQTGLSGIPQRFLDGLEEGETLRQLAVDLAAQAGTPYTRRREQKSSSPENDRRGTTGVCDSNGSSRGYKLSRLLHWNKQCKRIIFFVRFGLWLWRCRFDLNHGGDKSMNYVDGFVVAVPTANREIYREYPRKGCHSISGSTVR